MSEIIKTGVKGLDIILNGGIVFEKDVVIVLRGGRGIFKTLTGMQMMLGIQDSFFEKYKQNNQTKKDFPIHFFSLNKSDETLNKMFGGIVVSSEVENIKKKSDYSANQLKLYVDGVSGYDEFETEYDSFCANYKGFTAVKLNVWLLTSCQSDIGSLTGKMLFLARELSRKTEQNRSPYAE